MENDIEVIQQVYDLGGKDAAYPHESIERLDETVTETE